jgi:hypothetical protein
MESGAEVETVSAEDLLNTMDESSKSLLQTIQSCKENVHTLLSKVRSTQPPILHTKWKPKAATRLWLEKYKLSVDEVTIQEFLETFLSIYQHENRLELVGLTVNLRKEEAKLFHLPVGNVHFFDIMAALPFLFH